LKEEKKMNEKGKKLFYTWSNVDGEVCVYPSWLELLENENWEYLSDYDDSLDYFEAGLLSQADSEQETESKAYYKDNEGRFHEYNDEVVESEIITLYHGETLVRCVPFKAKEKVFKIQL